MAIHFDPEKGLVADSASTVREQVANAWKNAFASKGELNTNPETPAGQIIDFFTACVVAKDNEILYLGNQFNPETATGVFQDALARIYFLNRKLAQSTSVICECVGLKGTVIPSGAIVQDAEGNQYISQTEYTIDEDNKVSALFYCTEKGAIQCPANSINKIVTTVNGWDTVNNPHAGSVGSSEETHGEFEKRRYDTVAKNGRGSAYALEGAIKELEEVKDCVVLDNRTDNNKTIWGVTLKPHSVGISVEGGNDTDIAQKIYERLDAGCGTNGDTQVSYTAEDHQVHIYNIIRPTVKPIYIFVTINYTEGTLPSAFDDIKNAIFDDFHGLLTNPRISIAETVYASRFAVPIIKTAGVTYLVEIKIGTSPDKESASNIVTINGDEYPELLKDNIVVEWGDEPPPTP